LAAMERAIELSQSGKFLEAEKPLQDALSAIDSGQLPANELGRCLKALTDVNRELGRKNAAALNIALRYRRFAKDKLASDPASLSQMLAQNAGDLAGILIALNRCSEAEGYLRPALDDTKRQSAADPLLKLSLLVKMAEVCHLQDDPLGAKKYGNLVIDLALDTSKKIDARQIS